MDGHSQWMAMQMRMLLVAVALASVGAGKAQAQAGEYVREGNINLPILSDPEQIFGNTQGQVEYLPNVYDQKTTVWRWRIDDPNNSAAPGRYLRVAFEHSSPSVTANAQGGGSSSFGYYEPVGIVDSRVGGANATAPMSYVAAQSNAEGPKTNTLARAEGDYVREAFVRADFMDTVNGVTAERLRGFVSVGFRGQHYKVAVGTPQSYGPPPAASVTFSARRVEATVILLDDKPFGQ